MGESLASSPLYRMKVDHTMRTGIMAKALERCELINCGGDKDTGWWNRDYQEAAVR